MVSALRFFKLQEFHSIVPGHLNVAVSVPDDLKDLSLWGDDITNLIQAMAGATRMIEERQQEVVAEARMRGVTWKAIGAALGTTRQSAWARYSGEE